MIKVVAKAFSVLEVLHDQDGDGVRLSEVALRVKMPIVTVFRILRTLTSLGYVRFDGSSETYRIAQRLKDLGHTNVAVTLTRLSRPSMMRLLAEFEQTVNLAVFEQGKLAYRDMLEGLQSVRMQPVPGTFLSLLNSALGLSILAYKRKEDIEALLTDDEMNLIPRTKKDLFSELAMIRKAGYAVENERFEKGLTCIGAPIFDSHGEPIAAISVSGSSTIMTNRVRSAIAGRVKQECSYISRAMGYSPNARTAAN